MECTTECKKNEMNICLEVNHVVNPGGVEDKFCCSWCIEKNGPIFLGRWGGVGSNDTSNAIAQTPALQMRKVGGRMKVRRGQPRADPPPPASLFPLIGSTSKKSLLLYTASMCTYKLLEVGEEHVVQCPPAAFNIACLKKKVLLLLGT